MAVMALYGRAALDLDPARYLVDLVDAVQIQLDPRSDQRQCH